MFRHRTDRGRGVAGPPAVNTDGVELTHRNLASRLRRRRVLVVSINLRRCLVYKCDLAALYYRA